MASYPRCTCGLLKKQAKEFTARYEFKCSSHRVKVIPRNGLLQSNDLIKVTFILMPELPKYSTTLTKSEKLASEKIVKNDQQMKVTTSMRTGNTRRKRDTRKTESTKASSEISDVNELFNSISLLETFENVVLTIFVTCEINVKLIDGTKRDEILFAKLICPIVKPDILVLNAAHDFPFGKTAIGTTAREILHVKNISNRNVKVDVSLLDPFGPFAVAPGKTIEPGTILKLPITYRPSENHQGQLEEYFEVKSHKSRTIWQLKVSGCGVMPSWIISPQIRVARLETTIGKPVELKLTVQNTGKCPLIFNLRTVDVLVGNFPREQHELEEKTLKKVGGKEKVDGNKKKTSMKQKFSDDLYEYEKLAIYDGDLKRQENHGYYFSFRNFNENLQLFVPENEKVQFSIQFHPPKNTDVSEKKDVLPRKKLKDTLKKKDKPPRIDSSTYRYVGLFKLMLGSSIFVQDIIMICSIK